MSIPFFINILVEYTIKNCRESMYDQIDIAECLNKSEFKISCSY